jgi:hypothetical protein
MRTCFSAKSARSARGSNGSSVGVALWDVPGYSSRRELLMAGALPSRDSVAAAFIHLQ